MHSKSASKASTPGSSISRPTVNPASIGTLRVRSAAILLERWRLSRIPRNWSGWLNASAARSTRKSIELDVTKHLLDTVVARVVDRDPGKKLSKNTSSYSYLHLSLTTAKPGINRGPLKSKM